MQAAQRHLDLVFQALSDSTRRSMLREVSRGERTISQLAEPYGLTLQAISKHVKVLESASLIRRRKSGSFQMITLNPEALKNAEQWLAFYEKFWTSRMGNLKNLLEKEEDET